MLRWVGLLAAAAAVLLAVVLLASRPPDPPALQDRPVRVTNLPDPVPPTAPLRPAGPPPTSS